MLYSVNISFQRACEHNQSEIVRLMVTSGRADPQDRQRDNGSVALHEASSRGHVECVQVMYFSVHLLLEYTISYS